MNSLARVVCVRGKPMTLRRGFKLQTDIPKGAPPPTGFNSVANRVANILLNMTQKRHSNVLHVYPEARVLPYVGEVDYLAMTSLRNQAAKMGPFLDREKYGEKKTMPSFKDQVALSDPTTALPFKNDSFFFAINILPIVRLNTESPESFLCASPQSLPVKSILRVVTSRGYVVFGMPADLWHHHYEIDTQIEQQTEGIKLIQMDLPIPTRLIESVNPESTQGEWTGFVPTIDAHKPRKRATEGTVDATSTEPEQVIQYRLCVIRKH